MGMVMFTHSSIQQRFHLLSPRWEPLTVLSDTQLEAGAMVGTEGDSDSVIRKLPFCLGGHTNN